MTLLFLVFVFIVATWLVSRTVNWLPALYAREEAAWLKTLKSASDANDPQATYEGPSGAMLWRDFFAAMPSFNRQTLLSLVGVSMIALWVWLAQPSPLPMFCWFLFGCVLVTLALIDYDIKLLPDILTYPVLWLGLAIQLLPDTRTVGLEMAVIGAIAGYLPLWLLAHLYKLIRGRDGLGMGDLKLLAAMGAWSGPFILPQVLLLAALLAIAVFVLERVLRRSSAGIHEERPFGPAIVAAYFIVLAFAY